MDSLRQIKQKIIETAPSYTKYDPNATTTHNILYSRVKIGFSKLLYPFFHIEGANKMFDRRFKVPIYTTRLLGPRGEVFWILAFALIARTYTKNNLKREEIDASFRDRNVFYPLDVNSSYDKKA